MRLAVLPQAGGVEWGEPMTTVLNAPATRAIRTLPHQAKSDDASCAETSEAPEATVGQIGRHTPPHPSRFYPGTGVQSG